MLILLIIVLWFSIGVGSFIYFWTKDHDFTLEELYIAIMCGFIGVFTIFGGLMIHGTKKNKTIIKKRKR